MNLSEFTKLLKMKGGFELVNHSNTRNQIRLLGRVPKELLNSWLSVMRQLLRLSENSEWNADVSKQYFLRQDRLLFGWRIILQGENIEEHMGAICGAVSNAPRPKVIVEEQRLYGVGPDRNAPRGGKGAQGVLTAVVGPMAIAAQRSMGGG